MDKNPMLAFSVKIWMTMGFLRPVDNRRFIYLLPNGILNVLQLSFLLFSGESVESLILNSYFFVLYFNALVSVNVWPDKNSLTNSSFFDSFAFS